MVDILKQELKVGDAVCAAFKPRWGQKIKVGVIERINPKSVTIWYLERNHVGLDSQTVVAPDSTILKLDIVSRQHFYNAELDQEDLETVEKLFALRDNIV